MHGDEIEYRSVKVAGQRVEVALPRPLILVAEEFRRMSAELNARMVATPFKTDTPFDIVDLVNEHLALSAAHVTAATEALVKLDDLASSAPDSYFRGIARRLNTEVQAILDGYDELRSLTPSGEDVEGWSLLVEIYEEILYQIRQWCDEFVELHDDTAAFIRRRGLPPPGGTLTLTPQFDSPPQVDRLGRWLERRQRRILADLNKEQKRTRRRVGGHGFVVGVLMGLWRGLR